MIVLGTGVCVSMYTSIPLPGGNQEWENKGFMDGLVEKSVESGDCGQSVGKSVVSGWWLESRKQSQLLIYADRRRFLLARAVGRSSRLLGTEATPGGRSSRQALMGLCAASAGGSGDGKNEVVAQFSLNGKKKGKNSIWFVGNTLGGGLLGVNSTNQLAPSGLKGCINLPKFVHSYFSARLRIARTPATK